MSDGSDGLYDASLSITLSFSFRAQGENLMMMCVMIDWPGGGCFKLVLDHERIERQMGCDGTSRFTVGLGHTHSACLPRQRGKAREGREGGR